MPKRSIRVVKSQIRPTLRVLLGAVIAIGPGKADLLEAIVATGSISAAAKQLNMSYRRAWVLVDTMNRCFEKPLVMAARGGERGGGAQITAAGLNVLQRYRALELKAMNAIAPDLRKFLSLLRKPTSRSIK